MGDLSDKPDKVETKYCNNCEQQTEHNIYIKSHSKTESHRDYWTGFDKEEKITYTTTKQVCNKCGKTKTKSSEDFCCQIC